MSCHDSKAAWKLDTGHLSTVQIFGLFGQNSTTLVGCSVTASVSLSIWLSKMPPKILKQPSTKASRVNSLAIATIAFFMGIFVFFLLAGGPLLFREQHKSHIYVSPDTEVLAAIEETGVNRLAKMECGLSEVFPGCSPEKDACGRGVIDDFASPAEIAGLRRIAETAFKFGGGSGPPSIFDLASGAVGSTPC